MTIRNLGEFPAPGNESRTQPAKLYRITKETALKTIHGEKHPIPLTFFVSNDAMHMGEIRIPAGGEGSRASEPLVHQGDAVVYVLDGPMTFFIPDTYDAFEVQEGEAIFLPGGTTYQCVNYFDKTIRAVFIIAPQL
jgi:quercetin dioxygenase-like cupin family protein